MGKDSYLFSTDNQPDSVLGTSFNQQLTVPQHPHNVGTINPIVQLQKLRHVETLPKVPKLVAGEQGFQ